MEEAEKELFDAVALDIENKELLDLYQDIREYEVLLNEVETTDQERNQLIELLDSRWPYMNQEINITGRVVVPTQENPLDPEDITHSSEYVEDRTVESIGFNIMKVRNEEGDFRRIIGHSVIFAPEPILEAPMLRNLSVRHGFAPIDDIIISFPFESKEAYFDKVHYRFSDAAGDIDSAILNTSNESQAVCALADVVVPLGLHDTPEDLKVLERYINSLVDFDEKMPYQMEFEGLCYMVDASSPNGILPAEARRGLTLAKPLKINALAERRITDERTGKVEKVIVFGLRIELVNQNPGDDDGAQYIIPITDSFKMHDLRSLVYVALNSKSDNS